MVDDKKRAMSVKMAAKLKEITSHHLLGVTGIGAESLTISQGESAAEGVSFLAESAIARPLYRKEIAGVPLVELMFYVAWALLVISELVLRYNYPSSFSDFSEVVVDLLHSAAFLLLGIKAIVGRYSSGCQVVLILALGAVAIITSLVANTLTMLGIYIVLVASRGISFNKVAFIQAQILVIGVILGIALWKAGWLLDVSALRVEGDPASLMRHSLGFKHPNMLATLLLFIACSYSAYRGMNISFLHMTAFILLGVFTYFVTGSRTSAGMILLLVLLCALWKIRKLRPSLLLFIVIVLLLGTVLSLYLMVNFNWSIRWHEVVNNLLSQRCNLMNQYYEIYGITMFGAGFAPPSDMPLDNAYARLLLQNGLIPFIVFTTLIAAGIIIGVRKIWAHPYLMLFCFLCCFGFMEYYVFTILNFSLLFIPAMLYGKSYDGSQ